LDQRSTFAGVFFTRVAACFDEITVQVRRCKWYHAFLKTGADRNETLK
jgi:hypothetical protein